VHEDCDDASDEVGCDCYYCPDGTYMRRSSVCDFDTDCLDGEDEVGCAEPVCASGVWPPNPRGR